MTEKLFTGTLNHNKNKKKQNIERITGCIAEVCKLNVVAQKIPSKSNEIFVIDE